DQSSLRRGFLNIENTETGESPPLSLISVLWSLNSGMKWKQAHHVVVHNVREQHQEEHQSYLHEALLEAEAEIAPADAFHREQEDVSAIQDGNRQQIEDTEIQAKDCHQLNGVDRPLLHRLASLDSDSHEALQLPNRELSRE